MVVVDVEVDDGVWVVVVLVLDGAAWAGEVVVVVSGVVVVVELGVVVVVLVSGVVVVVELDVVVVLESGVVVVVEPGVVVVVEAWSVVVVVLDCAFTWVAADRERTAAVIKAGMIFLFMSSFYQIGRRHTIRSNPTRFFRAKVPKQSGHAAALFCDQTDRKVDAVSRPRFVSVAAMPRH